MNKESLTSQDISILVSEPLVYKKDNGVSKPIRYVGTNVDRYASSIGSPFFLIRLRLANHQPSSYDCGLYFKAHHWVLYDCGELKIDFMANNINILASKAHLAKFKQEIKLLRESMSIHDESGKQFYYIRFDRLSRLRDAYQRMIQFEVIYTDLSQNIIQ